MKTFIKIFLFITCSALFLACSDDDNSPKGEPLTLTASADTLVLVESQAKNEALTFKWNKGYDISEDYEISYIFRLDIAENNFESSTEPETIETFSKSFSVEELNELMLKNWSVTPGNSADLEARVVGKLDGPKFAYPEIAYSKVYVTTYIPEPKPLYLVGSASPLANDPTIGIKMNEYSIGKRYYWQGKLNVGEFKFQTSLTSEVPSLNKGKDNNTLVLREIESDPDTYFITDDNITYGIAIDRRNMQINYGKIPYEKVYVGGSATDAGWSNENLIEMEHSVWNPGVQTVVINLKEGELKFPTERDWGAITYRPMVQGGSIKDMEMQLYAVPDGDFDFKWYVNAEEAGRYKISLNMDKNTIQFEKQ